MALILLNMFIAILEGYFLQNAPKDNEEKIGIFDLVNHLVTGEFRRLEKHMDEKKKIKERRNKLKKQLNSVKAFHTEEKQDLKGEGANNILLPKGEGEGEVEGGGETEGKGEEVKDEGRGSAEEVKDEGKDEGNIAENKSPEVIPQSGTPEKQDLEAPDTGKDGKAGPKIEFDESDLDYLTSNEGVISKLKEKAEDCWFWLIKTFYEKFIKKLLTEGQEVTQDQEVELPQITAKVEFQDKRNIAEEGLAMKDIEFYLGKSDNDNEKIEENSKTSIHFANANCEIKFLMQKQMKQQKNEC